MRKMCGGRVRVHRITFLDDREARFQVRFGQLARTDDLDLVAHALTVHREREQSTALRRVWFRGEEILEASGASLPQLGIISLLISVSAKNPILVLKCLQSEFWRIYVIDKYLNIEVLPATPIWKVRILQQAL